MASWVDVLRKERKRIDRLIRKEARKKPRYVKPQWLRDADAERTRTQFPWMLELKARRKRLRQAQEKQANGTKKV